MGDKTRNSQVRGRQQYIRCRVPFAIQGSNICCVVVAERSLHIVPFYRIPFALRVGRWLVAKLFAQLPLVGHLAEALIKKLIMIVITNRVRAQYEQIRHASLYDLHNRFPKSEQISPTDVVGVIINDHRFTLQFAVGDKTFHLLEPLGEDTVKIIRQLESLGLDINRTMQERLLRGSD